MQTPSLFPKLFLAAAVALNLAFALYVWGIHRL